MNEYLFIYRSSPIVASPEEMQKQTQKWISWMKSLGETGHLVDRGQPLESGGKIVRGTQKPRTITDGPYAETKDIIGGYTLVQAKDLEAAAALSADSPIFESGGLVEVRPIRQLSM